MFSFSNVSDSALYDYIIVGAGSAGCIMAHRLVTEGKSSVLLLEAGKKDSGLWFDMPLGYAKLYYNKTYNYAYQTEPEPHLKQRRLYVPMGKVQGGSGSINAMIYVRGHKSDFDDWAKATDERWSYKNVLPMFKRLESHHLGDNQYHSSQGPIGISSLRNGAHPICDRYLNACEELGLPLNFDFNGSDLEGAGIYDVNIRNGRRDSSSKALVHKILRSPMLSLKHQCTAQNIIFDKHNKAIGVRVQHKGKTQAFYAAKEVLVCAGPIESPKLLQLSGIGDETFLKSKGIPVRQNLPSVGKNLQDHVCVSFYYESKTKTLNDELGSYWGQLKAGMKYVFQRRGPLSQSVNQAGGFFKANPRDKRPEWQVYFNPLSYALGANQKIRPEPYSGFLVAFNTCRPTSMGSVNITSTRVEDKPSIKANFLSTEHDIKSAKDGCHFVRKLLSAQSLSDITAREVNPGAHVHSDEDFLSYFAENSGSIYHQSGTCQMGRDPKRSVVSSEGKVHGMEGLRVVDASIFPNVTSGNTNAPTMMLAENIAHMMTN